LNVEPHFLTKNTVKGAPPADTLHARTGQAVTKAEAVPEAERAIDRALGPKKLKLVHPERDR
jgi:hypothetical protein